MYRQFDFPPPGATNGRNMARELLPALKLEGWEEAIGRLTAAASVALVLAEEPRPEVIGAAAALASGLRRLGKTVSVFAPALLPPGRAASLLSGEGTDEVLREFIISFDLRRSPIRELRYVRDGERLDIILSPQGSRLRREDVAFGYGPLRYDLAVTLGLVRPEAAAASVGRAPELLHEKPVLNMDTDPSNARYGEWNLILEPGGPSARPTLAELVALLLAALNATPEDPDSASALLASLAAATRNFRPRLSGPGAFRLAAELMAKGAALPALANGLGTPSLGRTQLAGRAVVRSRRDAESGTVVALLTGEDFLKTETAAAAGQEAGAVVEELLDTFGPARQIILLWQDPADGLIRGLLAAAEPDAARRLGELTNTPPGTMPIAWGSFPSFTAAEAELLRLLRPATEEGDTPGRGDERALQ